MAQDHRIQQQRFELKYVVPERVALQARGFVSGYLEPDDYAAAQPNLSYTIHSIYLDSEGLETHYAAVNGVKNRFKLRLRYYNDNPASPVFLEVKARSDNCILKQRCGVRREVLPLVLSGQIPEPSGLYSKEPRHLAALQHFNQLMLQLNAVPRAHNRYLREAWVSSHDNSVRVTFDRRIQIEPWFEPRPVTEMQSPATLFQGLVVLELKFTSRFPNWFRTMVQEFNLMQGSSAKYSDGVVTMGEHRFHGRVPVPGPEPRAQERPAPVAFAPGLLVPANS